ncbi:11673_t:CDS:2 [Ambispora leptoticha]|uniref:11673_t:CDS:1 n=1 Tax=Ambispora leptoticha TaxID=144679 RepID=A0A9N9B1Z6_9GLOM|nr:11673_t:CDS:2 [Ambispora leptoticha]
MDLSSTSSTAAGNSIDNTVATVIENNKEPSLKTIYSNYQEDSDSNSRTSLYIGSENSIRINKSINGNPS